MSEPLSDISRADLDRLVDGELPLPQLRALIERCDRRPEAWRNVAVAFLEAQAVSQALRSATERPGRPPAPIAPAAAGPGPRAAGRRPRVVALATTGLVSLLVGWLGGQASAPRMPSPSPATAGFIPGDADVVDVVPIYDAPDEQWAMASRESRDALENWTREQQAAGNHVTVRQWLVSLELEDGSHALAPVDELVVRPAAREFY
jgi:anti-sigma factor RsiW